MNKPTEAATETPQVGCDCGGDHRETGNRVCPVFVILKSLHKTIDNFLNLDEIFEFGKEGPMAAWLSEELVREYMYIIECFTCYQTDVEKHPEWHVTEEFSRLRRYFDQVAHNCSKENTLAARGYDDSFFSRILPVIVGDEEKTLLNAKKKVDDLYSACCRALEDNGPNCIRSMEDPEGYLKEVDSEFKDALDAIMLLPKSESSTVQELAKQAYDLWKEMRHLFFDFKPHERTLFHWKRKQAQANNDRG